MPIGTTIPAPTRPVSPARAAFPPARGSPLNPLNRPRHSQQSLKTPSSTNNHTHLSNLDRVLLKKAPPPPPQPQLTRESGNDTGAPNSIGYGSGSGGFGLFNALNLSSILPSLRKPATEVMSPRSLRQLQRLLSQSSLPSPKNSIASRWRQFHGSDDWTNLLDPLDENLRRELIRYGDLVQAAYHAFHSNPAASPSRHRHVIIPDRNYRVTKSLYATSSVDLPKWLDGLAPWMTQRSSWIGYVAVCDNEREIHRMGRRDIVIALRGTATCLEWAENFRAGLVPMLSNSNSEEAGNEPVAKVANGFWSLYKTPGPQVASLSATVVEEVRRLMELYKGEELSITVTGHSLGAALALFVADELSTCLPQAPPVAVFSFGGPRVGNKRFAAQLEGKGVKVLRVVNANDVITRVPGVLPREELGRRLGERWGSHVLEGMDGYVHVGEELRVYSRVSPYLRPNADPACCHDLESYLHLVDGFMGTGCPFRSDAKRSLVRLLDQQRPNVKKLYVSQARALEVDRFEPAPVASPSHVTVCLASPSA